METAQTKVIDIQTRLLARKLIEKGVKLTGDSDRERIDKWVRALKEEDLKRLNK